MMTKDRLQEIRTQLEAAAPNGETWSLGYESCDCGDGYGCEHDRWPSDIYGPVNVSLMDSKDEAIRESYGRTITEISELTDEAAELMAGAPQIIRGLLAEVDRQRERAKFFERAQARMVRKLNDYASTHEHCDVSQEESETTE